MEPDGTSHGPDEEYDPDSLVYPISLFTWSGWPIGIVTKKEHQIEEIMQDETLHKRFQCPVTKTHRDVERCKTCVENVGGARGWRCGLQTNKHGRIISSEFVHEDLEKRKKAEEAFEKSRTQPTPVDNMRLPELFETVRSVLNTLKPREREVLSYRFGLVDGKPKTLEEIGKQFNVTRERVRQIEVKALRKLRHPARLKKLAEAR